MASCKTPQKLKAGEFCRGRSCACPYNLNFFQQRATIWATTRVAPTGIFLGQGIFFRARNKIFFQWRLAKHPNEFCRGRSCACPYNLNFFQQWATIWATTRVAPTVVFLEQRIKFFFNGVLQNTTKFAFSKNGL